MAVLVLGGDLTAHVALADVVYETGLKANTQLSHHTSSVFHIFLSFNVHVTESNITLFLKKMFQIKFKITLVSTQL